MATVNKDFRVKAGLVVEGSTATVNGHDIITEALVDAKGDLIVASAADAVARLGVGTNGQVLTANSGATYGLEWQAPAAVGVFGTSIEFEGATANAFETTLAVTDPTADRTITLPDATGTVALTSNITTAIDALTTFDIEEGIYNAVPYNMYFTDERAQDAVGNSVGNGLDYDDTSGAISVDPSEFALSAVGAPTGNVSLATYKITSLGTPTDATDATTKAYVDGIAQGLDIKASVKIAVNENVDNALNMADPSNVNNPPTLDGVQLASGDRILLRGQTNSSTNGIYRVVFAAGQWEAQRTDDATFNTGTGEGTLTKGAFTFVENGTSAGKGFVVSEIGVVALIWFNTWSQFSGAGTFVAGNGLTLNGNSFSINTTITADLSTSQTLTNKTLTSPVVTGLALNDSSIVFEGSSADANETTLTVTNPTEDRTITFPDATGTVALTNNKLNAFAATSSSELAGVISDETGTGVVVYSNTPTLVTPVLGAATATSIALPDTLVGSATGTAGTSATNIDSWDPTTYSAAKYIVQLKKDGNIEVIEMLVAVDGSNNVYVTEYANIQSNTQLGTTDAVLSGGTVILQVTAAAAGTTVKVHKTLIEA